MTATVAPRQLVDQQHGQRRLAAARLAGDGHRPTHAAC
jgi:hypothetical protein